MSPELLQSLQLNVGDRVEAVSAYSPYIIEAFRALLNEIYDLPPGSIGFITKVYENETHKRTVFTLCDFVYEEPRPERRSNIYGVYLARFRPTTDYIKEYLEGDDGKEEQFYAACSRAAINS